MPDPSISPETVGIATGGGALALAGRMLWGVWRGWKATARSDRLTEQADKVERDTIRRLEDQIARMERVQADAEERRKAEIASLYKRIGEQDAKIEELTERLTEALDDRVKAIEECSRIRGDHIQMESRLTQQLVEHSTLTRAHADLCRWVKALSLSDADRSSPPYVRAVSWLTHHQSGLTDAA